MVECLRRPADQPTSRPADTSTPFSLRFQNGILVLFDRSGIYGSRSFGIHDEPDKRARALVGYATIDDNMMGLDTFVERKDGQITLIAEMRERLQFSTAHRFRGDEVYFDDLPANTNTSSKRKSSSEHASDDAST
ncbi:hypothetical protein E4U40_002921 [Claviceps sp. LM458 group G5]|nr:hypothetical protein E4U40_002921 [Claviceps sp. LM458 group G5]